MNNLDNNIARIDCISLHIKTLFIETEHYMEGHSDECDEVYKDLLNNRKMLPIIYNYCIKLFSENNIKGSIQSTYSDDYFKKHANTILKVLCSNNTNNKYYNYNTYAFFI